MSIRLKEKLTRRVLRYFGVVEDRPSKASVEPVSRTDDPGAFVMLPTGLHGLHGDGTVVGPLDRMLTRQHPLAPEREPPPLDWAMWSSMARENERRGWSFARFAARGPTDYMGCLFGIVRGPWGISKMDFWICAPGSWDTLHAITHLPSGMGCGLFTDQESAAAACDIAARLADDWETLDPIANVAAGKAAIDRMHLAWAAGRIIQCATHAHPSREPDAPTLAIWFQDYNTVVAGRPEGKLS